MGRLFCEVLFLECASCLDSGWVRRPRPGRKKEDKPAGGGGKRLTRSLLRLSSVHWAEILKPSNHIILDHKYQVVASFLIPFRNVTIMILKLL